MDDRRRGSSLIESLTSLLLTVGLLILIGSLLIHYQRVAGSLGGRVEGIEAARVARDLVSGALAADPGARVDGAELRVRTFVGSAEVCGGAGWRYRGRRLPDAARDSLWSVTAEGRIRVVALESVGGVDCVDPPVEGGVTLEADPPLGPEVVMVRVFESGRFRVDDALRYGRVGTGAQPLTGAVLDPSRSGLASRGGSTELSILPRGRPTGYVGRWVP